MTLQENGAGIEKVVNFIDCMPDIQLQHLLRLGSFAKMNDALV